MDDKRERDKMIQSRAARENVQGEASNSQGEAKKASKGKQKTINTRILGTVQNSKLFTVFSL